MKSTLFKMFAFGAGFALTSALLVGAVLWYSTRSVPERPWNKEAFKASLSDIKVLPDVDDWLARNAPVPKIYLDSNGNPIQSSKSQTPKGFVPDSFIPNGAPSSDSGTAVFTYIVENLSGADYSTTGASVTAMVRRPDGLVEETIKIHYPIFIPAGQKVAVNISIPQGDAIGPVDKNTDLRKAVREHMPKLSGFVLFDQARRFQIELPEGW